MEYTEIQKLIDSMGESKLTDLEIEFSDGTKISMKKTPAIANIVSTENIAQTNLSASANIIDTPTQIISNVTETSATEENKTNVKVIKAPMVGTFYSKANPNATPFVTEGDKIEKGQTLCIVEAMKLMNEIESDYAGVIKKVLVEDGQMVEYGQVLFKIE